MSAITAGTQTESKVKSRDSRMPFWLQVTTLAWRHLKVNFRTPSAVLPPLVLGGFFLIIYEAQLGGASQFITPGTDYINFILPLSIVSSSLSGAGLAGQSLVRDIENGYFDKLMLTPFSRAALILGPTLAGATILALQTTIITVIGLLLGLNPAVGAVGFLVLIGMSLLLGLSFAGFMIGVALLSGNAAATQGANFAFFPLTFLTATFVPLEQLEGWLKFVATINPITYVLDAMRSVMIDGWIWQDLVIGVAVALMLGVLTFGFSMYGLRVRTSRN